MHFSPLRHAERETWYCDSIGITPKSEISGILAWILNLLTSIKPVYRWSLRTLFSCFCISRPCCLLLALVVFPAPLFCSGFQLIYAPAKCSITAGTNFQDSIKRCTNKVHLSGFPCEYPQRNLTKPLMRRTHRELINCKELIQFCCPVDMQIRGNFSEWRMRLARDDDSVDRNSKATWV